MTQSPVQELQPHELNANEQEICRFIAMGYKNKEISELTAYTRQWIGAVRNNPLAQPFIRGLMKQRNELRMAQQGRGERLDRLRDSAYTVIDDIMGDGGASRSVRLRAASEAVRAHKEHVDTSSPEDRHVFDTKRIKELLEERKTLYVESEGSAESAELDKETHEVHPEAEVSEGREDGK